MNILNIFYNHLINTLHDFINVINAIFKGLKSFYQYLATISIVKYLITSY
jgi:hypothetical protein